MALSKTNRDGTRHIGGAREWWVVEQFRAASSALSFFKLDISLRRPRSKSSWLEKSCSSIVRVPGREFRFLAPLARQHLFLNLNQLIWGRRIRICLLSFRQSCECCQTNGFASPVLRDRVSMATKVTCEATDTKVCSFCLHFRPFCSIVINFSNIFFCSPIIEMRILNRG